MLRNFTSLIAPPVAVCRYGCASKCAMPIGTIWLAGLILLGFHFLGGPHNNLVDLGSLILGVGLILTAVIWARMTISQCESEGHTPGEDGSKWCSSLPGSNDKDPLKEADKASRM